MKRRRLPVPSPAMSVAMIALFAALGGTSFAVISSSTVPDSHGVFHACVKTTSGSIRIVAKASQCHKGHGKHKKGELAVSWSQFNGVGAGGDLTGTYPSPTIAAKAVTPGKVGSTPAAAVTNSGDVSIPGDSSHNVLSFNTDQINIGGVHSTTTNSSRLTAPIDGLYEIHGQANWTGGGASGFEELEIYVGNFSSRVGVTAIPVTSSAGAAETVNALVHLHAGDFVILVARQDTGSAITIRGTTAEGAPDTPEFDMHWVGPSS